MCVSGCAFQDMTGFDNDSETTWPIPSVEPVTSAVRPLSACSQIDGGERWGSIIVQERSSLKLNFALLIEALKNDVGKSMQTDLHAETDAGGRCQHRGTETKRRASKRGQQRW